jgi:Domain of unknown function (DUF4468) with TBP-like fold
LKQFLTLLSFFFLSISTYSQSFIITSNGLKSVSDSTKSYIVIYVDSVSAKDLYSRAYSYIQHTWKNPDIANNGKVEGEFLHVKTFVSAAVIAKGNLGAKIPLDFKYAVNLDFRDGKVKYEIADLDIETSPSAGDYPFFIEYHKGLVWCMYEKDGTVVKKQQGTKDQMESYFNSQLLELKKALLSPPSKNDF